MNANKAEKFRISSIRLDLQILVNYCVNDYNNYNISCNFDRFKIPSSEMK